MMNEPGPPWLIVGTRPDGSQLVIDQTHTRAKAQRICEMYRLCLEGYTEIVVENTRPGKESLDTDGEVG